MWSVIGLHHPLHRPVQGRSIMSNYMLCAAEELVAEAKRAAKRAPKSTAGVVRMSEELRNVIKKETSPKSLYWWPKGKDRGLSDRRFFIYWRTERIAYVFHDKENPDLKKRGSWYVTLFPCYMEFLPEIDKFLKKKGVYEYSLKMRRWEE